MNLQLKTFRGKTLIINYTNQDTSGNAISLAGATVHFTVKAAAWSTDSTDADALWKLDQTVASGNTCTFTSTPANTTQVPGTYYWDITINYGGNNQVTALTGTIQIIGTPTNRS